MRTKLGLVLCRKSKTLSVFNGTERDQEDLDPFLFVPADVGVHGFNKLLNQLKFISNELRIPIVALGTNEALYAMQTDAQIASRFEPFALPQVA